MCLKTMKKEIGNKKYKEEQKKGVNKKADNDLDKWLKKTQGTKKREDGSKEDSRERGGGRDGPLRFQSFSCKTYLIYFKPLGVSAIFIHH